MPAIATGTGRRITRCATRYHAPVASASGARRTDHLSMRSPSSARSAGSVTIAPVAASATTGIPAYANDRRNTMGNSSSADNDAATAIALNSTVRPAVATVVVTASGTASPAASSSRKRETTKRL